ncbi:MAG: right-handed parallel beta-helix repeat-containing protein [Prolixibacteraceae bacterium]
MNKRTCGITIQKIVMLLFFVALGTKINATNIYVATNGNNGNKGSIGEPFANIQKGLDHTFAGDTLFIRGGGYFITEHLKVVNSGEVNNWITIMAYPGEEVAINADAVAKEEKTATEGWRDMGSIHISGVHYIKISGLTVLYSHGGGIMVRGKKGKYGEKPTTNIEITHCKVYSSFNSGIGVWYADSVKVTYCEIMDANNQRHRPIGYPIRREAPHEALSVPGTSNFEIAYNYLHLCQKEGIDIKEFSSNGKVHHNYLHNILREGIYIDSWFGELKNIEVSQNIVHDCDWGILLSSEGKGSNMKDIYIHDNLVYKNTSKGIGFSVLGNDEPRENIYIYNNTICYNGIPGHWAGKAGGIGILSSNVKNMFVYNNLLYKNYGYQIGVFADENRIEGAEALKSRNIVFDNNCYDNFCNDSSTTAGYFQVYLYPVKGENTLLANPMFVDETNFNFKVEAFSPVLNKGIKKRGDEHKNIGADINALSNLPSLLPSLFLVKPSEVK